MKDNRQPTADRVTDEQHKIVYEAFSGMFQALTSDPRLADVSPDAFASVLVSTVAYAFNVAGVPMAPHFQTQLIMGDSPQLLAAAALHVRGYKLQSGVAT